MKAPFLTTATLLASVASASAQVGHDPATSPYRDLRFGQFVTITSGQVFGTGGKLGLGPHNGQMVILRHDFLADRPLSIALGAGWARVDRFVADLGPVPRRLTGPVAHDVWFGEGTAQLNLTGGKTWHSIAPYVNVGLGLAFGEKLAADVSGYKLGTKFYLAPSAGARLFLTRRMFVRVEARAVFWSLTYPATYRSTDPDGLGPLRPILAGQALKEWAPVPMIHAGLGYAFHNPFF